MKKILVVGIILLFIGSSIPALAQTKESTRPLSHTLYVGGSGPGNYSGIQEAINNATEGDTVFVYHGFYTDYYEEQLASYYILKRINLIGENQTNTILDGGSRIDVIRLQADGVSISGFTIQNSGNENAFGAGINKWSSKNVSIHDNIFKNNCIGINGGAKEYNNIFTNNIYGLYIEDIGSSVFDNLIENNSIGIEIIGWSHNIYGNQIKGNDIGIVSEDGRGRIHGNNFINNNKQAYFSNLLNTPSGRSIWFNNYWNDWIPFIPRPISGTWAYYSFILQNLIGPYPGIQIDWHPALLPHHISSFGGFQ